MPFWDLTKFIQLRSISKSTFRGINTNSDITPPNNLDMVTLDFFAGTRFCVYQGIATLINLTYQIGVMHKWLQLISNKGGCIT
jgi:hypothetical protein